MRRFGVKSAFRRRVLCASSFSRAMLILGDDWVLSPSCDMLPVLYASVGDALVARDFAAPPLYPVATTLV